MLKIKDSLGRIFRVIMIILLSVFIVVSVAVHLTIMNFFRRGDYVEGPTTNYFYDHYKDNCPRQELSFTVGENQLNAFLYGDKNAERLLVVCHGLGSGHEGYMNEIVHMVNAGYLVFTYDGTASGTSEGKSTKGLIQSALDLEAALNYIDTHEDLRHLPKFLMGHSWGGFAVAEALAYREDLVAVASIAGYAYPVDLLLEQGSSMVGINLRGAAPFFHLSQLLTFGPENFKRNVVSSNEHSHTPLLLIHGSKDEMIPLESTSIIAHKDKLLNPQVEVLIWEKEGQNGHNSIFHPTEELAYIAEKNQEFAILREQYPKEFPPEEYAAYVDSLDLDRVNKVNRELFAAIESFFDKAAAR